MDYIGLIVPAIVAAMAGRLLYGRIRYGSWTGSILKGRLARTVGEISLPRMFATSQTLQVHEMSGEGQEDGFVALVITSKVLMRASMQPYKLTNRQALELADYLRVAAQHGSPNKSLERSSDR